MADLDKLVNFRITIFDGTSTSTPKVQPVVSEPPAGLFTPEQFKWMEAQLEAREASIINRMDVIKHNASCKKPIKSKIVVPTCPLPAPSALKPIDYPYGMPMNDPKWQIGSSDIVGTNAMIANPTYTASITSANVNNWIDHNMSELAGFKPLLLL